MPNRYSHASVLSHYESRGFISYPDKGRSSPSPSASLLSFDLDEAYVEADNTATPPLTAVPPLCHASTNSTTSPASSFETVPSKPLHSASSSIVTEIYAPGSPVVAPIIGPTLPTKTAPDASKSFNDSKPPDRQPREETLFQNPNFQPNLRYSSAHYFPALCNQPRPSKKQKTAHDDQHVCTPEEPTNPMPISTIPRNTSTRTHKSHKTVTDQYAQYSKTPFERIQPSLSTESLAPLEFLTFDDEDIEDGGPSSPNAAVLPWEYSEDVVPWEYPDNGMPNVHRHSLESGDGDRSLLVSATAEKESEKERERDSGYVSFDGKPPEAALSTTSKSNSTEKSRNPLKPPAPSVDAFPLPPSFIPLPAPPPSHPHHQHKHQHHLSNLRKSHSTDSFDSAAPPPIRFHPAFRKELDALKMKGGHAQGPAYGEWMNRVGGRGDDGARAGRRR